MRIKETDLQLKKYSSLLNKFSLSAPQDTYREQYGDYVYWCQGEINIVSCFRPNSSHLPLPTILNESLSPRLLPSSCRAPYWICTILCNLGWLHGPVHQEKGQGAMDAPEVIDSLEDLRLTGRDGYVCCSICHNWQEIG